MKNAAAFDHLFIYLFELFNTHGIHADDKQKQVKTITATSTMCRMSHCTFHQFRRITKMLYEIKRLAQSSLLRRSVRTVAEASLLTITNLI